MITPKPFQDPHPPVLDGVHAARSPPQIAGSNGFGMLSFSSVQPVEKIGEADRRATATRGRERRSR